MQAPNQNHQVPTRSLNTRSTFFVLLVQATAFLVSGLIAGCGQQDQAALPDLDVSAPFVAIPRGVSAATQALRRQTLRIADVVDQGGTGNDFYLAINKKELTADSKWFLSSYLQQYFPGAVAGGAARSMGTRVVSFNAEDDKLFVIDADNRKESSEVFDPTVIVDAYPIVSYPPFDRLPSSTQFVLFDPSSGQNQFAVMGDAFAGGSAPVHFAVDLSYLSAYRSIADGITYQQVFSGYADAPLTTGDPVEPNDFRASGTLGIGLRRYSETMGYAAMPVTQISSEDLYFRTPAARVPDTGQYTQGSIKWAVSSTRPIQWVISDVVDTLQANPDYKDYDLYGALAKGVTGWNSVFGYEALTVRKGTMADDFAQDDVNFVIIDPDPSFGAAFADWRTNPNTGEIRGASVYLNAIWLQVANSMFTDDPPMMATLDLPQVPLLTWLPSQFQGDGCLMWAPVYKGSRPVFGEGGHGIPTPPDVLLTKKQKVEQYLTHVLLHEIGHTLGLRHNFKGSLKFDAMSGVVTSSVMDYLVDQDSANASVPQSYDIAAIKYLYGMSTGLPTDQFCNDDGTLSDPNCTTFDRTNDPLNLLYVPNYTSVLFAFLDGKNPGAPNNTLNAVLDYVRNGSDAATRMSAWNSIMDQPGYSLKVGKVDATKLASEPGYGANVDFAARAVLSRMFLDDPSLRGRFTDDPSDPAILAAAFTEAKGMISNSDGIRTADSRRMAATWLKKLQTPDAYNALAAGASELDSELRAGKISDPTELLKSQDALKYMDLLMNPYFY